MTDYQKGGRGKKAPYRTITVRIPEPLQPGVEVMSNTYKSMRNCGLLSTEDLAKFDWKDFELTWVPKIIAIEKAEEILRQKKSARQSLIKLLQVLYNDDKIELNPSKKE